ncbi:MAG: GNAT family N-acetyltransferase [Acidobacteriota bacterium]
MRWTTRPATAGDKDFLFALNRAAYEDVVREQFGQWDEAWQRQHFEHKWSATTFEIVESAGRRIGALGIERTDEAVQILEILVLPELQGQGIGTALLERELRRADEQALPVRLQVLRANRARTLYERFGFRICGETETHFLMERGE